MADIVGWILHRENICEKCMAAPAEAIIEDEDFDPVEVCRPCAGEGTDRIGETFKRLGLA